MMSIYEKPAWQLMWDMVKEIGLDKGDTLPKPRVIAQFDEKYPKIKKGTIGAHLIKMSINAPGRVHYNARPGQDDLFFQLDGSHFRLYDADTDPDPIYDKPVSPDDDEELAHEDEDPAEFAYESDLKNFLSKNLHIISPGKRVYEDGGITGVEFPVGGRFIGILAIDENNNFVVIELKVSRGYDRAVGQLLRYMGWISKNLAEADEHIRGLIVAREISRDLKLACSGLPYVELFEYQLPVSLLPIEK